MFSDGSRTKAGKFCRNPDNSLGGPWCYIEEENLEWVRKEYCDVPFCDDRGKKLKVGVRVLFSKIFFNLLRAY